MPAWSCFSRSCSSPVVRVSSTANSAAAVGEGGAGRPGPEAEGAAGLGSVGIAGLGLNSSRTSGEGS